MVPLSSAPADLSERSVAPVDLVHLARHTLGNRDLEQEVLRLFTCQSQMLMDRLKESADDGQRSETAHTLKGSARGIGAWRVAELAEKVESDHARMNAALTGDLDDAVGAANAFIRDLLNEGR